MAIDTSAEYVTSEQHKKFQMLGETQVSYQEEVTLEREWNMGT